MTEEERYVEKVKNDQSLLEQIAMMIPGYRGYKEKELRRDADQLIRNKVYTTLRMGLKDLKWCYRELINADLFNNSDQIDRLIIKADKISEKVNHAERGYSGIWQTIKVREGELYELMRYDASLIDISERIREDISQLKKEISGKNIDVAFRLIEKLEMSIDEFDDKFNDRGDVVIGLAKGGDET